MSETPPVVARALVAALFGDPEWPLSDGTYAYTYFAGLDQDSAFALYRDLDELEPWERPRQLMRRIEEAA